MFCTSCGTPVVPGSSYCGRCGQHLSAPSDGPRITQPSTTAGLAGSWRASTAGVASASVACLIVSLYTAWAYIGTEQSSYYLSGDSATVAFNAIFIGAIIVSLMLTALSRTSRFGAAMLTGTALFFSTETISDAVTFLRSGAPGSSDYYSPGPGYWWSLTASCLLFGCSALSLFALQRSGSMQFAVTRFSAFWATLGVLVAIAWLIGEWMPWRQTTITTTVDGRATTKTLSHCCSLSELPGQHLAEVIVSALLLIAIAVLCATLSSSAVASGFFVGAGLCLGASAVPALMAKPPTLAELADAWSDVTEAQLRQAQATTELHHLAGLWITIASVVGLLLVATARGLQPQPSGTTRAPLSKSA